MCLWIEPEHHQTSDYSAARRIQEEEGEVEHRPLFPFFSASVAAANHVQIRIHILVNNTHVAEIYTWITIQLVLEAECDCVLFCF